MASEATKRVFVRPLRALQKAATRQRPATAFMALERAFQEKRVLPGDAAAAIRDVLMQAKADPGWAAHLRARSRRQRELARLFDQLDATHPGTAAQLILGSGTFNKQRIIAAIRTAQLDKRAAKARGEARSEILQELARHGLEQVYGHFLRVVLQAHWAIRGEAFQSNLSFGTLVTRVSQLSVVPSMAFPIAGKVRNAAAHGHWLYDPLRATVALRDANGWSLNLGLSDVHRFIRNAVSSSSLLIWAASRSFAPILGELGALLSTENDDASEHEMPAQSLLFKMTAGYTHLKSLGWVEG